MKHHCAVVALLVLLSFRLAQAGPRAIPLDLSGAQQGRQPLTTAYIGNLAAGNRQAFTLKLPRRESLELRVPFTEAPFNGTQLNAQVNGRRLAPYFAFGGDIRYDAVKGKPGMRPPLATIEGRWVIPAGWLRDGNNELILWTTSVQRDAALERLGPKPAIRIAGLTVGPLDGARLPMYANSVYYDFDLWPSSYLWEEPLLPYYDMALAGAINGKGMACITPPVGAPESALWGVKRQCEDFALNWGFGHQEFYTIWQFADKPEAWAKFVDVDNDPETSGPIHDQTLFPNRQQKGADIVLYDTAKYAASLEPAIRYLAPYTDFYNFKCEQNGPRAQGFGVDGERLKEYGIHGDLWARNHYEANKAARDLVRLYDPDDGRVQEMHHWRQGLRPVLYDTALKRGQPMGDLVDILMVHYDLMEENDRGLAGLSVEGNAFDRQFPYPEKIRPLTGDGPAGNRYPESAIEFNRYRLSRTEQDMTLGDAQVNRWGTGQPFDFRAGFRGDEMIYNSENSIWRTGYAGPSTYQFLHGFFSYSLLPTGAGEPRDMKITVRKALNETEDLPVRRYGEWVNGAGGTKRLRTVDPLYGDMFGWTGQEWGSFGDYISMPGLKEPHHRVPPNDAFGLVRRTCYAFVTTGPIVPLALNRECSDRLFVKSLVQTFNGRQYLGIYTANFTGKAQRLDVTLPIAFPAGTEALVFDDRAWDWKRSARPLAVPAGKEFRYKTTVPALGAWLVLIPVDTRTVAQAYRLPAAPVQLSPMHDGAITEGLPAFTWNAGDTQARFTVEVAREAIFRPQDRIELAEGIAGTGYTLTVPLQEKQRYFWRVCAVDAQGRRGPWSPPRAFVYRWPEYSQAFPPRETVELPAVPAISPPAGPENLAWLGEIWGTGGYMNAPSRAIDGQSFSFWTNGMNDGNSHFGMPAEWCVLWRKPTALCAVTIHWHEELLPLEFILQVSDDGKAWTELFRQAENIGPVTEFALPQPVTARFFRILIPRAKNENGNVGIREVSLR
ncbi:MAG: discoidin domain-containing protein [Armatimonadota bacterium]